MKRKLLCLFFAIIMCVANCIPASAGEMEATEGAILITVETQEEVDAIIAEIEASNRRVSALWEAALAESVMPPKTLIASQTQPYTTQNLIQASKEHVSYLGMLKPATIIFWATYTVQKNEYGATVIENVREIGVHEKSLTTTLVEKNDIDYTVIDQARTIATKYALMVGVKTKDESDYTYYAKSYYVEFYASGGVNVFE